MFSPRAGGRQTLAPTTASLAQPKTKQPSPQATDTWGSDNAHVRLLARLLQEGPLRRPATRLRKRYEDKANGQNTHAVTTLAKGVADIYAVSPKHVAAIAAAVGKNSDIVRIRTVGEQLSIAARYAPIWRKLVEDESFAQQAGTHFADYKFVRPLELINRVHQANQASLFPVRLEDMFRVISDTDTCEEVCGKLADMALWGEKSSLKNLLFGTHAPLDTIDDKVMTDGPTHDALLRVARRLNGKDLDYGMPDMLQARLLPLLAQFCAPSNATMEERREKLSAATRAWPEVQEEYAALHALGYATDNARHERAYTVHDQFTGKSTQVTVAFAHDIFSAADSCVSRALGGCYSMDMGLFTTKPLENGISPASRFISIRDASGNEIEVAEVSFTKQGLWADRFERDHNYNTLPVWMDYLQHLVRTGVVPSVIVRSGDDRALGGPLFERMRDARPDWIYKGPTVPLERINVLFCNTYYDTRAFGNGELEAGECLHIRPDNLIQAPTDDSRP